MRDSRRQRRPRDRQEQLGSLVRLYAAPLTRFFSRRVTVQADVPDLLQEVFLRLSRLPDPADIDHRQDHPSAVVDAGAIYRTAAGQRMTLTLQDGSLVALESASQVRVAYSDRERRLVLDRGQAFFEVARHRRRPFVVTAGDQAITAHGTAFDVRVAPGRIQVLLLEGKVTVASPRRQRSLAMRPYDLLVASATGVTLRRVVSGTGVPAWRDRVLAFEDRPLGEAVTEMNLYSSHRFVVRDEQAAAARVSGAFRADQAEVFAEALRTGFPLHTTRLANGDIEIAFDPAGE